MHGLQAPFGFIEFQQRKIHDPKEAQIIFTNQLHLPRKMFPQVAERGGDDFRRIRDKQQQIVRFGGKPRLKFPQAFRREKFRQRRLQRAVFRDFEPCQPFRAEILDELSQLINIFARQIAALRDVDAFDLPAALQRVGEDLKFGHSGNVRNIHKFHAVPQIRVIHAEAAHRLLIRQTREGRLHRCAAQFAEHQRHQRFHFAEKRVKIRERRFNVNLREFRLPVGAQVFVAEAFGDLKIFIEPGNHQHLFEQLRRLRQREKMPRMHAARHEIITRPFRRAFH